MNKEKQIEEMAKVICPNKKPLKCADCVIRGMCNTKETATEIYNAGYRKQSEVVEEVFEWLDEKGFGGGTCYHLKMLKESETRNEP